MRVALEGVSLTGEILLKLLYNVLVLVDEHHWQRLRCRVGRVFVYLADHSLRVLADGDATLADELLGCFKNFVRLEEVNALLLGFPFRLARYQYAKLNLVALVLERADAAHPHRLGVAVAEAVGAWLSGVFRFVAL